MADGTEHRVTTEDGDFVVLHVNRPESDEASQAAFSNRPTMLLVHGLSGSYESGYLNRVGERLLNDGWNVVRFDMRGCGASTHLSKGIFHAARAADLKTAVHYLESLFPSSTLVVAGYSLGANLLLRMLGEQVDCLPKTLQMGIAVAPPIDLETCCRMLSRGLSSFYDKYFVRRLWREFQARRAQLEFADRAFARRRPKTLFDFDQQITAPVGGFETVEAYYLAASSKPFLNRIKIPTRILIAQDDPVVPFSIFDNADYASSCEIFVTKHGGHLGYVGKYRACQEPPYQPSSSWEGRRYLDWLVQQWASAAERSLS